MSSLLCVKPYQYSFSLSPQGGDSALILAVSGGHTDIVMELVKAEAKLDLKEQVHITSLLSLS